MAPGGVIAPTQANSLANIAILLPLSGPRADLGKVLLQAAQLALQGDAAVKLDVYDTGGTPSGAAAAVALAITNGDNLIIGPLTSAETAAISKPARTVGIPVLALTNDTSQSAPGIWTLGISPDQQVLRLVLAAQARDKTQFASLLPDTDYGRAMETALRRALADHKLGEPIIRTHGSGMAAITAAARDLSDYANRRGPLEAKIRNARDLGTAEGRRQARELAKNAVPQPPFDVLMLADTGDELQEVAAVLPYFDVDRSSVQLIGPALWADPTSGSAAVMGAWYAAPDSDVRSGFTQAYSASYGALPPPIADLAYDAASIVKALAAQRGIDISALTQQAGFIGSDGWLAFTPDGHVNRALAVYRIERAGPAMIDPAPSAGL